MGLNDTKNRLKHKKQKNQVFYKTKNQKRKTLFFSVFIKGARVQIGDRRACLWCLARLIGKWPLKNGKHGWCLVCGCETESTSQMKKQLRLTEGEYNTPKQHGQLDKEGAALYTCDKKKCKVALCSPCLMRLFGAEAMLEASKAHHWECPICTRLEVTEPGVKKAKLEEPGPPSRMILPRVAHAPPGPAPNQNPNQLELQCDPDAAIPRATKTRGRPRGSKDKQKRRPKKPKTAGQAEPEGPDLDSDLRPAAPQGPPNLDAAKPKKPRGRPRGSRDKVKRKATAGKGQTGRPLGSLSKDTKPRKRREKKAEKSNAEVRSPFCVLLHSSCHRADGVDLAFRFQARVHDDPGSADSDC